MLRNVERRVLTVQGIVQGVGFRPFVHGLAMRFNLVGFIRNHAGSVRIEVEGEAESLDQFARELTTRPPPLARIDDVSWERQARRGEDTFRIETSEEGVARAIFLSPDVATCDECLAELFDPADRRYRYPFLNCTNCGPRLTIITGAPYDRERTTMATFPMCLACRAEYEDPTNRRFHAQPVACPACGPRLEAYFPEGTKIDTNDPLTWFAGEVMSGKIGALKGLGGYHLVCDARSEAAVAELRKRKQRDQKPFAIMVGDLASAEQLCELASEEAALLTSSRRPILLLAKRPSCPIAPSVVHSNPFLGVMLPYTPLHHLLLDAVSGVPLVMTSGNHTDEPIAYDDDDALHRLAGVADVFLTHNRPIHVRCEDSVTRVIQGQESPMRRSRGYAPEPLTLPHDCSVPILAVGGQMKATFALGREHHALLSHHLGDLDHHDAYRAFVKDVALYETLFAIRPEVIVHDLHPDYASTRYALKRAVGSNVRRLAVQHHHAHMASCMAEHGLREPVIGVTFDGTGYGSDGAIWGGEFLVGDYRGFRRAAHLRYVGMPGGQQAIHEPWRMALAHLVDAQVADDGLQERTAKEKRHAVRSMLERRFHTPLTSSVGRLFDAIASLLGIRDVVSYEGQAAMELEWLATGVPRDTSYPFDLEEGVGIDTRPTIRALTQDVHRRVAPAIIARRFHSTVAELIVAVCERLRQQTGLDAIVLSGGVFLNILLTREVTESLSRRDFLVYTHKRVPANDGGLSLGQLVVAAVHLERDTSCAR